MADSTSDSAGADTRAFGDVGTRLLLDNHQVRIWELLLQPGESSDLHHHQSDYVMVQIEGDRIAAEFEPDSSGTFAGHRVLEGEVAPGQAIFAEAGGKERAVNVGAEPFREIIVEVKARRAARVRPIQHVSLVVTDIEQARPFYVDVLGLAELARPGLGAAGLWLAAGNGVQIRLIEDPHFTAAGAPYIAFETSDLDAEVRRLRALGVEVSDPVEVSGAKRALFADPSGNRFELDQPPVASGR